MTNISKRQFLKYSTLAASASLLPMNSLLAEGTMPAKIGFIYISPLTDAGWTYSHDLGRLAIEKQFGNAVTTHYVESVSPNDINKFLNQYKTQNYDLVFATSFSYMNQVVKFAKSAPRMKFEIATGYKTDTNVSGYDIKLYHGDVLFGSLIPYLTKSKIIGVVGTFPIAETIRKLNALALSMQQIDPSITVKVIWMNAWENPTAESEITNTLINQGADVIVSFTDSYVPNKVADSRKVYSFGKGSDMSKYAPNYLVASSLNNWGSYYVKTVGNLLNNQWKSGLTLGGYNEQFISLTTSKHITPQMQANLDKTIQALKANDEFIWLNTIVSNKGEMIKPKGAGFNAAELANMTVIVKGIEG